MSSSGPDGLLQKRFEFACTLARDVGREALQFWQARGPEGLGTQNKGLQDFVTLADQRAEDTIRTALADRFPGDGFLGEETGGATGPDGYWVVDPIDGTANYMRGMEHWGVSIAFVQNGKTRIGVVHDSPMDRLYTAQYGLGAARDGVAITVSRTTDLHQTLGILGVSRRTEFAIYLNQLHQLFNAGVEQRRMGSAAIGIVRVAEGVADFYYEKHLNCWDALGATLIAREAGADVFEPDLSQFIPDGGEVFCASPKISGRIKEVLMGN